MKTETNNLKEKKYKDVKDKYKKFTLFQIIPLIILGLIMTIIGAVKGIGGEKQYLILLFLGIATLLSLGMYYLLFYIFVIRKNKFDPDYIEYMSKRLGG